MLEWLLGAAIGPAAFALPVNWAADALAGAAQRWFRRFRRTDGLSRLVRAATGSSVDLTRAEFDAVRKLLEDQQTWILLGRATVEDLATRIADCLPLRDGRTDQDSHAAALTIVRGLLEFAVADLDPKDFQRVLLARLKRMETDQASALDKAMFGLHADLLAGFASLMEELKRVLDRLPPGPAQRGEIMVYLKTLIGWLNTDTWPQDRRFELRDRQFDQPALTPAAIERRLRITAKGKVREQYLDADGLAKQCHRLVILGGAGSGKTWLAKRTARRCAEEALEALAAGGTLDEVELPLYTTCSRLFTAEGSVREAAVSSAVNQVRDLGGSRLTAAIREFFTDRNAPTLLVIDSLDEAHGSDDPLRQADWLPWRIVLTSRQSSWNNQFAIAERNDSHRIGELQPLRYPDDVEPFIQLWFDHRPEGNDLATQIARRPDLQQAATVPLILAFYCIVGGDQQLPDFRRDLYDSVLKCMLTGRWRGSRIGYDTQPNVDTRLETLRAWAWSGAVSHQVSRVGTWADDILTEPSQLQLGEADEDALGHVASPLGPPDIDGKILRRFIHRSIREHLVAEHVASLPLEQAVETLLPHLWYDPDWEYSAPAALAMHRQHNQLLRDLICRAANSEQIPHDLSFIDAGWELRGLLARVAAQSSVADWLPEMAAMIGQARLDLARAARFHDLGEAASWEASNRQAREVLLGLLADQTSAWKAEDLVGGVVQLAPTADDKRQARQALLGLLAVADEEVVERVVSRVVQLAATADDKRQAREALLGLLAAKADGWAAAWLAGGVVQLDPTADDKRQARQALLGLLAAQANGYGAEHIVGRVVQLASTAHDKRQAREALLGLLATRANGWAAARMADGVVELDPTADDKRRARETLLGLLANETYGLRAADLANEVAQLDPTADDKRRARETLLGLLVKADWIEAESIVGRVVQLAPTADDKRQTRETLLRFLVAQADGRAAARIAGGVAQLAPTADDKRQARETLLGLLDHQTYGGPAWWLADGVVQLAQTADDKRQAREALLGLLAAQVNGSVAARIAGGVAQLAPTADDKRQARETLLGLLGNESAGSVAEDLIGGVIQLAPTADDKRQAREMLLGLLARQANGPVAVWVAGEVAHLDPTADDKYHVRTALLRSLTSETNAYKAAELLGAVVRLDPTVRDLSACQTWEVLPTSELLVAVRQNSDLADWLTGLPSLPTVLDPVGWTTSPDSADYRNSATRQHPGQG